ncbi:uncharacterized protein LOC113790551 [Dermatophagoides pteronyssinus]|uniref:uncharacterized protein LOC113790551 n=1 Tax=Dermatophagoides pteronyssinus TaxID=6956 RepID=UPI003F661214
MSDDYDSNDNNNINNDNDNQSSNLVKKKIHWQLIERRRPQSVTIRTAIPTAAADELRMFVEKNHLQYRHQQPKHPLDDFENLFNQLNLNDDDELLDRAERRDLPAKFQQLYRKNVVKQQQFDNHMDRSSVLKRSPTKTPAIPARRSAMPNVILDDVAYRRYDKNRQQKALPMWPSPKKSQNHNRSQQQQQSDSICYMFLDNYEDWLNDSHISENNTAIHDDDDYENEYTMGKSLRKNPDLIQDDLLNRRLKQSSASRVPTVPPLPFGIPNTPITTGVQTTGYSNVELDQIESRKQRFRTRESSPHLINDDFAFRMLRHDVRDVRKEKQLSSSMNYSQNYCDSHIVNGSPYRSPSLAPSLSSNNSLSLEKLRKQLRPTVRDRSSISSATSSSSSSNTTDSSYGFI